MDEKKEELDNNDEGIIQPDSQGLRVEMIALVTETEEGWFFLRSVEVWWFFILGMAWN